MEKTIDLQAEVKKVYPTAFCLWDDEFGACGYVIKTSPLSYGKRITPFCNTKLEAWSAAYNTVKNKI